MLVLHKLKERFKRVKDSLIPNKRRPGFLRLTSQSTTSEPPALVCSSREDEDSGPTARSTVPSRGVARVPTAQVSNVLLNPQHRSSGRKDSDSRLDASSSPTRLAPTSPVVAPSGGGGSLLILGSSAFATSTPSIYIPGGTFIEDHRTQNIHNGNTHNSITVADPVYKHRLEGLPRVDAARYDSFARNAASSCLGGTREELLCEINEWFENNDKANPKIFWLCGLAGTGKTTVAQTVAEKADNLGNLGASFFFSRDEVASRDAARLFPTIAFQLSHQHPRFLHNLVAALDKDPQAATATLRQQFQTLLAQPLRDVGDSFPSVLVVIDALDECVDVSLGSEIIKLLAMHLPRLPCNIKFLITSRPEHEITSQFKLDGKMGTSRHFILHDIEMTIVSRDIERVLRDRFSDIALWSGLDPIQWPSAPEIDALVGRAEYFFIYVITVTKFIGDHDYDVPPKERLQALLQNSTEKGSSPYEDLDNLYQNVLEAAILKVSAVARDRWRRLLNSIARLVDRLPLAAIAELLKMECERAERLLKGLSSIVDISVKRRPIRVVHPSFLDFLIQRCQDERFTLPDTTVHEELALCCFDRMKRTLKQNILGFTEALKLNSEIDDLQDRLDRDAPVELRYACLHWSRHLVHVSPGANDRIFSSIDDFCSTLILYWMELLSYLGRLDSAVDSLMKLQHWLRKHAPPNNPQWVKLQELVTDGLRFVVEFFDVISQSALHIYHSAIPFAPSDTAIVRVFGKRVRSRARVLNRKDPHWSPCLRVIDQPQIIHSIALSPDGTQIVSGSGDNIVRVWDSATGAFISNFDGNTRAAQSVAFSPNGGHIASGSEDHVTVWDAETGVLHLSLVGHTSTVTTVAFSDPDGKQIASGSADGTLRVWDSHTGVCVAILEDHSSAVMAVAFAPDGLKLASGSQDRTIRVWVPVPDSMHTGIPHFSLEGVGHTSTVTSVAFSPNGRYIVSGAMDNTIRVWNAATAVSLSSLEGHSEQINSVIFSLCGTQIVSGSDDKTIKVWGWNESEGLHLYTLDGHSSWVTSVKFTSDGSRLVSSSWDQTMRIWNTSDTEVLKSLTSSERHSADVTSVAFSPDVTRIASGALDATIRVWDISTGKLIRTFHGHVAGYMITSVVFSSDGPQLISGSHDRSVRLWDSYTGRCIAVLDDQPSRVTLVAFTPDEKHIVSGTRDNIVRVWDPYTGTCLKTFAGHVDLVVSVAFSPDGTQLVSGSHDKSVRMWSLTTGEALFTLEGHLDRVTGVSFSPDGAQIVAVCAGDTVSVRIWNTAEQECIFSSSESGRDAKLPSGTWSEWHTNRRYFLLPDSQWVTYLRDNMSIDARKLWIPSAYRGAVYDTIGDLLVVGSAAGHLTLVRMLF